MTFLGVGVRIATAGAAIHIVGPDCQGCPIGVGNCPGAGPASTTGAVDPLCARVRWPQSGSYSSQVVIRDCIFKECDQAVVNWADWATFSDSWISSSCAMQDKAVIENHDRLFISNICGVPCGDRWNETHTRWIDNYAHRVDGGMVHVKNFRFGGEAVMPALVNFAPYMCLEVLQSPDMETQMCGRVNRSGASPERYCH